MSNGDVGVGRIQLPSRNDVRDGVKEIACNAVEHLAFVGDSFGKDHIGSDLMVAVFDDKGRHARAAVSAASLPFGVAVEIEGTFQIS